MPYILIYLKCNIPCHNSPFLIIEQPQILPSLFDPQCFTSSKEEILRVIVRHCTYSNASQGKQRPKDFNRELLFKHLLKSLESIPHTLIVLLDKKTEDPRHFVQDYPVRIECGALGNEAQSFLKALDIARTEDWGNDTIVFLEDDYAVAPLWNFFVEEGLKFADYVSLYDHPDKYSPAYAQVPCILYKGLRKHWRTTPSTTNSYACKRSTLLQDFAIHTQFSKNTLITNDHEKFLELWNSKRSLVTCIPSAWSHEEINMNVSIV